MSKKRSRFSRFAKRYGAEATRVVALVLTIVMCVEAMLGNGVSIAIAQGLEEAYQWQQTTQQIDDANGAAGTTDQAGGDEAAPAGDSSTTPSGDEQVATDGSGSTGNAAGQDGTATGSDTGTATDTDGTGDAGSTDATTDSDAATSDTGAADQTDPAAEGDANGGSDTSAATDDEQDQAPSERTAPRAWEGDLEALDLSSTGLVVASDQPDAAQAVAAIIASAAQSAAQDAAAAESATSTDSTADEASSASEGDADAAAPAADPYADIVLSAQLNLTIKLDPVQSLQATEDVRSAVIPGDTLTVALPDGIAPADPAQTFAVYQRDAQGNATTIKIADAAFVDGALKLTFVEPQDAQGTTYLVGAAAQDGAQQNLAAIDAGIDMDVTFPLSLAQTEASQLTWTLQTKAGVDPSVASVEAGTAQAAVLAIPARADLEDQLGIPAADDETDAAADATDGSASPTDEEKDAAAADAVTTVENALDALTLLSGQDPEAVVTVEAGPFNTQIHSQTIWCDNNYGSRPTPDSLEGGYKPRYSLNGTDYYDLIDANGHVTARAKSDLHLDDADVQRIESAFTAGNLIQISQSSVNTYDVYTMALPGAVVTTTTTPQRDGEGNYVYDDATGEQLFNTNTSEQPVTWMLQDNNSYAGTGYTYLPGASSTWDKQYKMLATTITFNVVGKTGDTALKDIFGADEEAHFQFGATIDGDSRGSMSVARAVEDGWLSISDTDDGCTITGTVPQYDENGLPIVYYVQYTGPSEGKDYYQASYDNSASPSHGSATGAVYDGGIMTLRHAGTTTFTGTKVWLDSGDTANRPAVTYTLWRYSTQGSPETASQVSVAALQAENPDTPATNATGFVSVEVSAGSQDIDFHKMLVDEYGEELIESLPKYDPDGYPYIYCLREDAVSGYEQVFGSVQADGSVSDTLPRYENENGGWIDVDRASRPATDRFVYNGGTLSNRVTGTTATQITKTWSIAAFQDSLQDVVCTFQAQSRTVDQADGDDWVNVTATGATQTLTSWNAETLSKTIEQSFPKYDAHGNELEYRWIETNVTLDGQNTSFTANDDGSATFTISVASSEGGTEQLAFTSTPTTTKNEDGSFSTTIENTFENVTDQHVDKYWEQADGSLAQIAPDPAYSDSTATVELYQDGTLVGTFTMDGRSDSSTTPIEGLDGATWQESRSYHIDFEGLPKYSAEGKRYTYLVLETSKEGWTTERTYDAETRTTRIDNYFPEGEGSEIRVTKSWIDGDDAEHRYTVRVNLVANHDMHSRGTNPDGSYVVEYHKGEVVATVDLSEAELWYAEVDVPIGGLTYRDFTAVEVGLVASDNGTPDDMTDDTVYRVLTKSEAEADPNYQGEAWINAGWTNPDNRRVATPEHVYEVRSTENDTLDSCEVTNRRLGLFDLTVEKTWNDALGTAADGTRPGAVLTLCCDEYPQAFSLDADGNLQVSISANTLPVTVADAEGNPVQATIVDADGNPAERGSAQVTVDTSQESSTYTFTGMPKYDANGLNVHYTVNESWTEDYGDYYSTKTVHEYVVEDGMRHFQDHQTVEFDNSRSGSREVRFYKIWHDNYVSQELNQRPDIYLTLYRVSANQPTPEAVPGYIHFSWSAIAADGDAANEQMVTISGLAKYDNRGAEYVYYASESMSADGTSLGYGDVQFDDRSIEAADAADASTVIAQADTAVKIDESAPSDDPKQNGSGWAIREDGTFVNRLDADLVAQGTKLWENIPGNVSQGDLPAVTIYLQRKLASDDAWPAAYATQNTDGTWKVSGTVASTDQLTMDANNQYSYTIETDCDGSALPRFDSEGNRYEYRALEVVWGLLDQPGGFTAKDIKEVNLSEVRDGTSSTDLTGAVYVIEHGETGSFLLRNIYGGEATGNLTVKKLFDGREQGDAYPDVTFEVYRYYQGYQGVADAASPVELVASHTIAASEFDASGDGGNGSASYTFEDLDIYAPDGSRWIYFVAERTINGYTTTVAVGDITSARDARLEAGDLVDANGNVVQDGGVAMRSDDLGDANKTVIANDDDVDVTFANTYAPGSAELAGTKIWYDSNNIFSVRPTEPLELSFERTAGSMTEEVTTQSTNARGANYLAWTQMDQTGDWTFTLSNVEQWAPNGRAWEYTVTETLPDDAQGHYIIVTGTSSATAGTSDTFRLENALSGRATVIKNWNDGNDPYGLRPSGVTMQLQARYKEWDGGSWSNWDNAYTVWTRFASADDLKDNKLTKASTQLVLSDTSNWRGFWNHLPVLARLTSDSPLNEIEYRVVEVAIGNQDISSSVKNGTGDTNDGVYATVTPYQPAQESWEGSDQDGWTTTVSNTLQDMAISATKTWTNDEGDAWDTRPGNGSTWSVTYFLQRSTDGTDWQWVVADGSGADPHGSATQNGVVSRTITGTEDSATATWDYLPQFDTSGTEYQYRVVEQVPGSYDVEGGTQVSDTDTDHRYYVVKPTAGGTGDVSSTQQFTNDLRRVDLTGTKQWEDFGSRLTPKLDQNDLPQMTLWRAVNNGDGSFGTAERVLKNGNPAPQPTWIDNGNGTWTFTYSDLPAANASDQAYVYWAVESAGSGNTDGFYPVYGTGNDQSDKSHGAEGTTVDRGATAAQDGQQTNEVITNTATKITLDKISNWVNDDPLTNIELSIQSRDGATTYAVWTNGADGKTYSTYTWVNGTTNPADTASAIHRAGNLIVGLKAGDYTLVETGGVPDGYAIAPEVDFQINADGTATFEGASHDGEDVTTTVQDVVVKTKNGVHTIELTAEDPVLRGHLQLTKYVSDDGTANGDNRKGLQGATFSLYRQGEGGAADQLVAVGLKSNAQGVVTTVNSDVKVTEDFAAAYDHKYGELRDGLPEGTYYFVETSTTPGAVLPSGDAAKSPTLTISQDNHYDYTEQVVNGTMENEKFNATVILHKYDTTNDEGIEGINFTLTYTPEGATKATSRTVTTGAGGTLTLENLEKGSYTLTEQTNAGYANSGFTATFTIGNEVDDRTFDIKNVSDGADIDFKVTSDKDTYTDGTGIPNVRSEGKVTLNKRGNRASINATFDLQVKTAGGSWSTVVSDLATSNRYDLTWNDDGMTAVATDTGDQNTGVLVVEGLTWNTYRFVETATAPGYLPENADGAIVSTEFTIGRTTQNMATSVTVQNAQTSLELNKQNEAGQSLDGAVFTVTPVDGSQFADGKPGAKRLTASNGGHAVLTGQLIVGGTYEIYEAQGPTGYDPVDATFQVTVKPDGSLEVVGGDDALPTGWERADIDGDQNVDNQFSFMATNNHLEIVLTKVSSEDGTTTLEGATFRLEGQVMNDNDSWHDYTTGANGTIAIDDGLMGGVEYTLRELSAPAGYIEMAEPLRFRMDNRGEITPVDSNGDGVSDDQDIPDGWSIGDGKITLTAADDPVKLAIQKVDGENTDTKLGGAEFTITPVGSSEFATADTEGSTKAPRTITTDSDTGMATMTAQLMVGGTYTIEETKAPAGYTKIDGKLTVTVQADGSLRIADGTTAPEEFVITNTGTLQVFTGTVTNDPTELTIKKVDATTNQAVSGASFTLTGNFADGTTSQTLDVTADDGAVSLDKALLVADGETAYTLAETTAPDGYELIQSSFVFTVDEQGTITPKDEAAAREAGWMVGANGISVRAADTPIVIDLVKVGRDSGAQELAGAEFVIKPVAGSSFANPAQGENENGIIVTPENIQQVLDKKLIGGNTYTLRETVAPAGYELIGEELTFSIETDGSISKLSGPDAYSVSYANGVAVITATDTPIEVQLAKTGSDASGALLDGAVFALYHVDTTGGTEQLTPMGKVEPTAAVALELNGLVGGETYLLRETTAPAGYELLGDLRFTVGTDGAVTFAGAPEGWTQATENGVVTITATDPVIEVQLLKTDAAGTPLAGAGFEIKPEPGSSFAGNPALNGNSALEVGPSGADGSVQIPDGVLIAGNTYTITEVKAPDGYELAGTATFTVGADGAISIVGATGDEPVATTDGSGTYLAGTVGGQPGIALITATDELTELTIKKAATDATAAEGKIYLSGAEFTLTEILNRGSEGGDGDPAEPRVLTGTTDENGQITWTGLKADTSYVLEETTAPAGYERLTDTATIVIAPDGTVTIADGNASAAFTVNANGVEIEVIDRYLGVSLVKTDLEGTGLVGGEFMLAPATEGATFPDGTTEKTFTSDEFGAVFTDLQLTGSAEGTPYVLTETRAPEGYELIAPITFLVYEDGTVGLPGTLAQDLADRITLVNDAQDGIAVITLANTPIELSISKISTQGDALTGAVFTIAGRFADGATEHTLTVGADGTVAVPQVIAGESYTLTETRAPEGYDLIGGEWTFTVNEDGTIQAQATSTTGLFGGARSAGYDVSDDGVVILAVDSATPLGMPNTGDAALFAAGVMGIFALTCIAGGLELMRRKR